ncbi:hypothetical protein ABZ307_44570 [Streptomyces griseorubiginosus]|uniref:hypothetical protein n=1 Tax=Streptomyces griseorubiginosus TaxID=67304 RepID=UPI0033A18079
MPPPVLACAIVLAALVIRSAVAELRNPGEARRQWGFVTNKVPAAAGSAAVLVMVVAIAAAGLDWGNLAWAVLAGLLIAFITDQLTDPN